MAIVARSSRLPKSLWHRFLPVLAASLLSACSAFPMHPPQVQLQNVEPESMGIVSQTFTLVLRISNPNDSSLDAKGGEARLYVQDRQVAYGVLDKPLHVPAFGAATVDIPVTGNLLPLLGDLGKMGSKEGLPYQVRGYLVTGWFNTRVPFSVGGTLRLPLASSSSAVLP